MESFERYMDEFVANAENTTYEKAATYTEIRRANEHFIREEELSRLISERYSDRASDIAAYLDDERPRVRRSVAYLLLSKMKADNNVAERAVEVLREYSRTVKGDEALNARGFLLAWESKSGNDTRAADDISLFGSLKNKYCGE